MRQRPILHGWIAPAVATFFAVCMVISLARGPRTAAAAMPVAVPAIAR